MRVLAIEHVQLAMPKGEEQRAREFYSGLLGIPELVKPPHLAKRGGVWFEADRLKIHLGIDPDFRPARKAHPALLVEGLAGLVAALRKNGYTVVDDEPLEGFFRVWCAEFGKPFLNKNNRNAACLGLLSEAIPQASFVVVRSCHQNVAPPSR